jgi:hypothetical protein
MRSRLTVVLLLAAFLVIYLPDIGHGFIKDDFGMIESSRSADLAGAARLFTRNDGFYRPFVSVSFAFDDAIWRLNPFGYGLTNLLLSLAVAALIYALARRLELPAAAAVLAAAVWAFNFHGINMAVLWISGRSALLLALFALLATHAFLRGRPLVSGVFCLCAMFCKEEAILLPVLFTMLAMVEGTGGTSPRLRAALARTWPLFAMLPVYAALRVQSGAFDPTNAPPYYQFTSNPRVVLRNAAEFADRALTVSAAVILVIVARCGWPGPALSEAERRVRRFATVWIPTSYALTVFLPVRSSLYAVVPSIGACLVAGAFAAYAMRTKPQRFRQVAIALVALLVVLIPVYKSRNVRWVRLAEVSSHVVDTLRESVVPDAGERRVVLIDNPGERFNLEAAFGGLLPAALRLNLGTDWTGEIVVTPAALRNAAHLFRLENGGLVRVSPQ